MLSTVFRPEAGPAWTSCGFLPSPSVAGHSLYPLADLWQYTVGTFQLEATAVLLLSLGLAAGCVLACHALG